MRKTIAQRMHQSLQTAAQLSMDMTAQMDDAVRLRGQLLKGMGRPGASELYRSGDQGGRKSPCSASDDEQSF